MIKFVLRLTTNTSRVVTLGSILVSSSLVICFSFIVIYKKNPACFDMVCGFGD